MTSSSKWKESLCKLQSLRFRGDHGQDAFSHPSSRSCSNRKRGARVTSVGRKNTKREREREREIERDRRMRGDGMRGREKGNREWNCFSSSAPSVIFFSSSIYFFYLFLVLRFSYLYAVCYGYTWAMKISLHSLQSCKHSGIVKLLFVKQYTYHINILLIYWIFINYENFICINILIQFA